MTQKILLSAGGTGGHVFPAIALAKELHAQNHQVVLATDARTANYDFPDWLEVHILASKSPAGGLSGKISGIMGLLKGCIQAAGIMKKFKPDVVVGFGGYPSFPAVAMAMARSLPLVLHEQNRVLGKANRIAAPRASRIAASWPDTMYVRPEDASKLVVTGNPARPEVLALRDAIYPKPQTGEPIELLVFAGSQGARAFSDVVPAAIGLLPQDLRKRLRIVQQCRAEDIAQVQQDYDDFDIQAELAPFFDDMPQRLQKAHLVLCRAGASTATELMVLGRPAIYVPLAIAADNHQTYNAQYLEEHSAGWLLPSSQFDAEALAARLQYCLTNPDLLEKVANEAYKLAKCDAAAALASVVLGVKTT